MKILLLEDDIALHKAIATVLKLDRHSVDSYFDGTEIINVLNKQYDLYILDINVPHISGLELLDTILLQNPQAKVIMISSNTDIDSVQTAYDLGCVDYLKKPFHVAELRAKIHRLSISRKMLYAQIMLKADSAPLAKKEKKLLDLLLEHSGQMVSYEMIENYVYVDKSMTMDALRALVRRLRSKLAEDIIVNFIDEGYGINPALSTPKEETETETRSRLKALQKENEKLKAEKNALLKRSHTDPLTGLYNRLKIQEVFLKEQQRFSNYEDPLSVILLDLDNFKSINDQYGHNTGDKYLKKLADGLKGSFREVDVIGRWGGEEFIILLPNTSLEKAKEIAQRVKEVIHDLDCPLLGSRTASFGISTLKESDTLSSFVGRADEALLQAKAEGKDRINAK